MRRLMQVSFVVLVLFILAFGLVQLARGASAMTMRQPDVGWNTKLLPGGPEAEPNVGWNSRPTSWVLPAGGDEPNVGWNSRPTAWFEFKPCVGWNA